MKLNKEQIDRLYQFTIQHYVEYYDLQTELVDHLANAIEQQWQENPNISFEDALQTEFKKFGIFGFTDLIEERQKALIKKYYKLIWMHFREFFKIPKVIMTTFAIFLVYQILITFFQGTYQFGKWAILLFLLIKVAMLLFGSIVSIINARKRSRRIRQGGKRWLLKEMIFFSGTSWTAYILPLYLIYETPRLLLFYGVSSEMLYNSISLFIISVFYVFCVLFLYIANKVIPSKGEQYLKQTYPEYEISK
ncbi:MAG: hypothetical protein ACI7YS_06735 [Flavobacterium sp.]